MSIASKKNRNRRFFHNDSPKVNSEVNHQCFRFISKQTIEEQRSMIFLPIFNHRNASQDKSKADSMLETNEPSNKNQKNSLLK